MLGGDAQNPQNWFESAKKIIASMEQLKPAMRDFWISMKDPKWWPPVEYNSVYLMLAALAIENLCKGFVASRLTNEEKRELQAGRFPKRLVDNHQIGTFFKHVGFNPTAQDCEIVSRIQVAIDWRGRYPLPKNTKKLPSDLSISGADDLLVARLIKRLVKHVVAR